MTSEPTPGAFYRAWRLMAVDGSTLDVPDTSENVEFFAGQGAGQGQDAR